MYNAKAFSAASATSPLASTTIARRDPTETDVQIEILFCGICHSDLHQARNEWSGVMPTVYPCVPGHEIVGRVAKVGSAVTGFKVGDLAAVGCMVDSDRTCPECQQGLEQFCPNLTLTYNFPDKHTGGVTYGGYSDSVVVDEKFVLKVPANLDLAGAAPLLCAGITTFSPLHHWGVTKGKKVGIVGLGGLGHMGVKFAHALGTPTGTVQFLVDNVATGSPVSLASGSASYVLSTGSLSSGAHTVTAAYSGDTTFAGSKGSVVVDITSASAADFSLTPSTATATTASGKSAPGITFTVSQLNGFTGSVTLNATSSTSGLIASGVFSVNPVIISTSATSGTSVLTLSAYVTNSLTATPLLKNTRAASLPDSAPWRVAGSGLALAGLICFLVPGRRRRITGLLVAILSVGMLTVVGCSSSGTSATSTQTNAAPGTYTILVTASGTNAAGTALSHSSTVTFVVQ